MVASIISWIARAISVRVMKVITADNCSCNGSGIYHADKGRAIASYIKCLHEQENGGNLYWSVHIGGKHILNVIEAWDEHGT
jgi:hypothetical protein